MAIRSGRLVFSLISDQGYYTFIYVHAKHNREGGRKEQTNKHWLGSAPSARGGIPWHFLFIPWANASVYSSETPTKATSHADFSLLRPFLSHDCSLKPTYFFSSLLLTIFCLVSDLPFLVNSRGRSRTHALCVGFTLKQTKRPSDRHPHTPTQRMPNKESHLWLTCISSNIQYRRYFHYEISLYLLFKFQKPVLF